MFVLERIPGGPAPPPRGCIGGRSAPGSGEFCRPGRASPPRGQTKTAALGIQAWTDELPGLPIISVIEHVQSGTKVLQDGRLLTLTSSGQRDFIPLSLNTMAKLTIGGGLHKNFGIQNYIGYQPRSRVKSGEWPLIPNIEPKEKE